MREPVEYKNPYEHVLRLTYGKAILVAQSAEMQKAGVLLAVFRYHDQCEQAARDFHSRLPIEPDIIHFGGFSALCLPMSVVNAETMQNMVPWDVLHLMRQVQLAQLPLVYTPNQAALLKAIPSEANHILQNGPAAFPPSFN